jgi:hypothetical protein
VSCSFRIVRIQRTTLSPAPETSLRELNSELSVWYYAPCRHAINFVFCGSDRGKPYFWYFIKQLQLPEGDDVAVD